MITVATYAHELLEKIDLCEKTTVDLTCGRGNDTLYLCQHSRFVVAFDIQKEAIDTTRRLLTENKLDNYRLVHASHETLSKELTGPIGAFIYNLGYLPHGDKTIVTHADSTLSSLNQALELLEPGGVGIIVVYQKHEDNEAMIVKHFVSNLPSRMYDVLSHSVLNKELAPYVIEIKKL